MRLLALESRAVRKHKPIEITQQMVDAGISVLFWFSDDPTQSALSREDTVTRIFRAMSLARYTRKKRKGAGDLFDEGAI